MRRFILVLLLFLPLGLMAQGDDFGIWYMLEVDKQFSPKWSAWASAEYRTRDDARSYDCFDIEADVDYQVLPWLKLTAGYMFMVDKFDESSAYDAADEPLTYRPDYKAVGHRVMLKATFSHRIGRVKLSLREQGQYNYYPEKTVRQYDYTSDSWGETTIEGKGKYMLRTRPQVSYNIPGSDITPYVSVEFFNRWRLERVRYTFGADWAFGAHHELNAFYRYQHQRNSSKGGGPSRHIIAVGYKYKF